MKKKVITVLLLLISSLTLNAQFSVYFDFGQYKITEQAKQKLDALLLIDGIGNITIIGFTDSVGSTFYNKKLSKQRANAVNNYLLHKMPMLNISTEYKGETIAAATNALNRVVNIDVKLQRPEKLSEIKKVDTQIMPNNVSVIKIKRKLSFTKIYFNPSVATFKPEAFKELELLYNTVLALENEKIEIRGHINWPGSFGPFNTQHPYAQLSERRAKAVYNYLNDKGVKMDNFSIRGMGNSEMVYPNANNLAEMEQNMRVEIVIIE